MTEHVSNILAADPAGDIAQLRRVLGLVAQMAGRATAVDETLDADARIGIAYADALPIAQRRFDARAAETNIWAAAGLKALIALQDGGRPTRAAASRLAAELDRALADLGLILA